MTTEPDYIETGCEVFMLLLVVVLVGTMAWWAWTEGVLLTVVGGVVVFVGIIVGVFGFIYALGWAAHELPPRIRGWVDR